MITNRILGLGRSRNRGVGHGLSLAVPIGVLSGACVVNVIHAPALQNMYGGIFVRHPDGGYGPYLSGEGYV